MSPNAESDALEQVAELLHPWLDGTPHCPWESPGFCPNTRRSEMAAEDVLDVLESREADAWKLGNEAGLRLARAVRPWWRRKGSSA